MIVYDWVLAFGTLATVLYIFAAIWCVRYVVRCKRHTIHRYRR